MTNWKWRNIWHTRRKSSPAHLYGGGEIAIHYLKHCLCILGFFGPLHHTCCGYNYQLHYQPLPASFHLLLLFSPPPPQSSGYSLNNRTEDIEYHTVSISYQKSFFFCPPQKMKNLHFITYSLCTLTCCSFTASFQTLTRAFSCNQVLALIAVGNIVKLSHTRVSANGAHLNKSVPFSLHSLTTNAYNTTPPPTHHCFKESHRPNNCNYRLSNNCATCWKLAFISSLVCFPYF